MKHLKRFLVGIAAGLTLAVVMGGAAAPAHAAGVVVYVDDDPDNNGKTKCKATSNLTIEQGIAAIGTARTNVKLYICPGFYYPTVGLNFSDFTNLKIIGKGGPIITAPVDFSGGLFHISDSRKVTVQGLNINGGSHLGSVMFPTAIYYGNSSGTIKGNTISAWHQTYTGDPPVAVGLTTYGIADYAPGIVRNVTITKNSIYDSQDVGIYVQEGGKAKVTKNRIVFSSAITPAPVPPEGSKPVQVGIILMHTAPGAVVSGNQIQSDSDLYPTKLGSRGILIYSTSKAKVTKNTVRGTAHQISIESYCDIPSFPDANSNVIKGNKLYDSWYEGLSIYANGPGAGCADPHADHNKFTGNKIYNSNIGSSTPWGAAVYPFGSGVVDANVIKGNTFAGFLEPIIHHSGDTNSVFAPNKILVAPPPGPLSVPAEPAAHEAPGPLPAYLLNPQ